MKAIKSKRKILVFCIGIVVAVFFGLFVANKIETERFFYNKRNIRIGMKVPDLIKLVGRPTFELLIDSTSINVTGFPKELIGDKNKYYIFTYTAPSLRRWIWKFNNLDFSYDVYIDEKKERVVFF